MKKFREFVTEKQGEWRYEPNTGNITTRHGHIAGTTWYKNDTKGANIMKHKKSGKFYAAGGASTAYFPDKTKLYDTPEDAAKEYHNK